MGLPSLSIPFLHRQSGTGSTRANPQYGDVSIPSDRMKVGRFEEVGATGSLWLQGILVGEEYNPDLTGEKALKVYDKMWRSDGQIAALLQVLTLPILRAKKQIIPASDDPVDLGIARMVHDNLFGGMRQTWQEHLRFALLGMLRDGFAVEEKVYGLVDTPNLQDDDGAVIPVRQPGVPPGKHIALLKLAPRLSKTIYRWYPNADDELDRLQQRVWRVNQDGLGGEYEFPVIPGWKLVVYTHQKEGNNWFGVSVLRPAYMHWWYKNNLLRIDALAAERGGVGIPTWKEPPNAEKTQRDIAAAVGQSIHAGAKDYILEPFGWDFRFESVPRTLDVLPSVQYHDMQIARSMLAQFMNLDKSGLYNVNTDFSSFFLQSLQAVAHYLEEQHNRYIIRPLVDLNFVTDRYPTLSIAEMDKRDVSRMLPGLANLYKNGGLTNNASTENALRAILGLPDLPEAPIDVTPNETPPTSTSEGKAATPTTPATKPETPKPTGAQETPASATTPAPAAKPATTTTMSREDTDDGADAQGAGLAPYRFDQTNDPSPSPGGDAHPRRPSSDAPAGAASGSTPRSDTTSRAGASERSGVAQSFGLGFRALAARSDAAMAVDHAKIHAILDELEAEVDASVWPLLEAQIDALVTRAKTATEAGEHLQPTPDELPKRAALIAAIARLLWLAYEEGQAHVGVQAQAVAPSVTLPKRKASGGSDDGSEAPSAAIWTEKNRQAKTRLGRKAKTIAAALDLALLGYFATLQGDQADSGQYEPATLRAKLTKFFQRAYTYQRGGIAGGGFQMGKASAALATDARVARYETMEDPRVCSACAALDGTEVRVGTAEYDAIMPPNPDCAGGERCRCQFSYDWNDSAEGAS